MRDQQCGAKADLRRDGITDTESADLFTALYFYVDQGVNYGEFSGLSPSCIEGQGSFFPDTSVSFDVGRMISLAAVKAATEGDSKLFVCAQKESEKDEIGDDDVYTVGSRL